MGWALATLGAVVLFELGGCGGTPDPPPVEDASPDVDGGAAQPCADGESRACGTDVGECVQGTQVCEDGLWGECQGATGPTDEICNGADDDCNGTVDDGPAESCNGADDDCDGSVDEDFDVGAACDVDGDGCLDDAIACVDAGRSGCTEGAPQADQSRMGIDYLLPFIELYDDDRWAEAYATLEQAGIGWVNFADISPRSTGWGSGAGESWEILDRSIRRWQEAGFRITMSLKIAGLDRRPVPDELIDTICEGDPACEEVFDCEGGGVWDPDFCVNSDRLPIDLDVYREWISTLVDRYDCDGGPEDVEGLVYPIRHFQVGNEYANVALWTGTLAQYGTLLEETRAAVAGQDVVLISNGIRWNDLFHDDPEGTAFEERFQAQRDHIEQSQGPAAARAWDWHRSFTEGTIGFADLYDVLDAGGNGPYPTATEGYMSWVRSELPNPAPPIWDMEARTEPRLVCEANLLSHCELTVRDGDEVLAALYDRARGEATPEQDDLVEWYRREQASVLGQVLVKRLAAGAEKVFIGQVSDWDDPALNTLFESFDRNMFVGLVDRGGTPQPAFYAYLLGARLTSGFSRVETLLRNRDAETAAPEGDEAELHRFTFADGRPDVLVAWQADEADHGVGISRGPHDETVAWTLDLEDLPRAAPYCLYRTPATAAPATAERVTTDADGALAVVLTPAPVWITPAGPDGTCP